MMLTLDQRVRQILRHVPRGRLFTLIEVALIALVAVQAARLIYAIVTPVSPAGDWRPREPMPMAAEARAQLFARVDPFYRQQAVEGTGTATVTSLSLQLFGLRTNAATGGGSAIVAGEDGVQKSVGVGEEIQPGVRLVAVHFDHIEIERSGARELLYLDQADAAPTAAAGAAATLPAGTPAQTTAQVSAPPAPISPSSIRAGVGFAPRAINGRVTGIAVNQQGDGSAFAAVGFRPGDVIRAVNGRPIASVGDVAALTSQLQPGARISLEVERGAGTAQIAVLIPNGNP